MGTQNKQPGNSDELLVYAMQKSVEQAKHLTASSIDTELWSTNRLIVTVNDIQATNNVKVILTAFFKEDVQKSLGDELITLSLKVLLDADFTHAKKMDASEVIINHSLLIEQHKITITILYFIKDGTFKDQASPIMADYKERIKKITEHFS